MHVCAYYMCINLCKQGTVDSNNTQFNFFNFGKVVSFQRHSGKLAGLSKKSP